MSYKISTKLQEFITNTPRGPVLGGYQILDYKLNSSYAVKTM